MLVIARIFGFSTVDIQTAGASGNQTGYVRYGSRGRYRPRGEGYIPGVSVKHAEEIQAFVIKKISKKQGSGL